MSEHSKGWKWWQKGALAGGLLFVIALAGVVGFREDWVEPVPGVRTTMTRPFLKESDLGPNSAYMLLLEAVREPTNAKLPPTGLRIWANDWTDAVTKLQTHPWPTEPPPPAPKPSVRRNAPQDPEEVDPMLAPLTNADVPGAGLGPANDVLGGLPSDDPALAADAPWTREQYEDIQRLVKLYEPRIATLDRAIAAPDPQVPTADSPEFLLPYLQEVRELARWLSVSAQRRATSGDYDGALRDLERTMDMADLITRGGCLINHLVAIACDAIAAQAAWDMVTRHNIPPAILKKMSTTFLAHIDSAEPFVEAMRNEALCGQACVKIVYRSGGLDALGGAGAATGPGSSVYKGIMLSLVRLAGSSPAATARNLNSCYQHLVAIAEKPYSQAVQIEYGTFTMDLTSRRTDRRRMFLRMRDPVGYILACMLLPALDKAHCRVAQRDATLRGMAVFCAVEAYRKEKGSLPESLDRLVPDYLATVPADPFDGKPFRYLKTGVPELPAKAWAVYSIGDDFRDDGGKAYSVGAPRKDRTFNPDLVWPSEDYPPLPPNPEGMFGGGLY